MFLDRKYQPLKLSSLLNLDTHVMLLVLMAVTVLTSLSLFVFTAVAVWKLDTLITGLLLFVVVLVTFVDGELAISEVRVLEFKSYHLLSFNLRYLLSTGLSN